MAFPGTATNNVTQLIPPYTQRKFPRKNEALGAIQIIIALIHLGLGGILFFSSKESVPLCMASWYPFWGAGLFIISGSLSAAAATATNITEGLGILALMLIFSVIQNIVSKAAVSSDSDKSQDHKAEFPLLSPPQPQSNNGTSPPWQ
ncbi:B-lymphocyte antigen CD20-like isoform X1 [Malaclemys terrapin pileata]|uniref:B-lymphocyte antigen CD20-like isoform X1 n=1 Tax=Malaclemys terrapin pileata TaxID=2991368 RepID=UPI0023A88C1B|nr:B-lymphocyte antigen CD20-like isoform X1 [Malaclemys terrapin pileata]